MQLRAKPSVEQAAGRIETRFSGPRTQFLVSIRPYGPTRPANRVTLAHKAWYLGAFVASSKPWRGDKIE